MPMVSAKPATPDAPLVVLQPPTAQVVRVQLPRLVTIVSATAPSTWTTTVSAKDATPLVLLAVDQVQTSATPVLRLSPFQVVTPVSALVASTTTQEVTIANRATILVPTVTGQVAVNASAAPTTDPSTTEFVLATMVTGETAMDFAKVATTPAQHAQVPTKTSVSTAKTMHHSPTDHAAATVDSTWMVMATVWLATQLAATALVQMPTTVTLVPHPLLL